jgi:MFS family permease
MHFETDSIRGKTLFSILGEKNFRLYFIAWLMFSLVDSFESVVLNDAIIQLPDYIRLLEPLIAGISALFAGIFSDWIGRKKIMIFGFISLGIAYAILGIAHGYTMGHIPGQIYTFYFVVDGVAIGLLWVLFTIVLWGDMPRLGREKYYALGETPLFLTQVVSLLSVPLLTSSIETAPIFSLAAFFLFISVIPLLYARETLPMKNIQERQLKTYTEEALKLKQEAEQKQT